MPFPKNSPGFLNWSTSLLPRLSDQEREEYEPGEEDTGQISGRQGNTGPTFHWVIFSYPCSLSFFVFFWVF